MNLTFDLAIPVIALTFIGVAAGEFPGFKMNRATITLVGAVLLVALGVMTPNAALHSIDPNTLLLLFAMLVISAHLRLAGFFSWIGQLIARHTTSPRWLLAWVVIAAGVLAAFFMNDTVVVVFTPLVLEVTEALRRNPLPYLIGLAAAANIGSTAAITGNPQNILIGLSAHISFAAFLGMLGPVALIGLALAWLIIVRLYRLEFEQPWPDQALALQVEIDRPLLRKSLALVALMLAAFLAGAPVPLAAIAAAAALLVSRRIQPEAVFSHIDWSLLVFFAGLFVVTGALESTHFIDRFFTLIAPLLHSGGYRSAGVGPLALVTMVLSNLVSNVPAVLLIRPLVPHLPDPRQAWLTLAMASTLAGNLTLLGSVANLIVAETARARGVQVSFGEYLKAGLPITLVTVAAGVLWLSVVGG
jgi:Na+/H+ antiporter NhaD/arsenite permease-like protein